MNNELYRSKDNQITTWYSLIMHQNKKIKKTNFYYKFSRRMQSSIQGSLFYLQLWQSALESISKVNMNSYMPGPFILFGGLSLLHTDNPYVHPVYMSS